MSMRVLNRTLVILLVCSFAESLMAQGNPLWKTSTSGGKTYLVPTTSTWLVGPSNGFVVRGTTAKNVLGHLRLNGNDLQYYNGSSYVTIPAGAGSFNGFTWQAGLGGIYQTTAGTKVNFRLAAGDTANPHLVNITGGLGTDTVTTQFGRFLATLTNITNSSSDEATSIKVMTTLARTTNGTSYFYPFRIFNTHLISTGVVDGGHTVAAHIKELRDNPLDDGRIAGIYGSVIYYGHWGSGNNSVTDAAYGLRIIPRATTGTLSAMYDLEIDSAETGATIGPHWGIYQAATTIQNYFGSSMGVHTQSIDSSFNAIGGQFFGGVRVVGDLHVGGAFLAGSLGVGNVAAGTLTSTSTGVTQVVMSRTNSNDPVGFQLRRLEPAGSYNQCWNITMAVSSKVLSIDDNVTIDLVTIQPVTGNLLSKGSLAATTLSSFPANGNKATIVLRDSIQVSVPGLTTATGVAWATYVTSSAKVADTAATYEINAPDKITLRGKNGWTIAWGVINP